MLSKCFFLCLSFGALHATTWYDQHLEGWYYYQDRDAMAAPDLEAAQEILAEEKQNLHAKLALAVLAPTKENVKEYARAQDRWMEQSSMFADTWAELKKPEEKSYFLLFCFRGEDPASIQAAGTAKMFAAERGLELRALSLDGVGIEDMEFEIDKGLAARFGIQAAPSLHLVDPVENTVMGLM